MAKSGARANFEKFGEVAPVMLVLEEGRPNVVDVRFVCDDKEMFGQAIIEMRKKFDAMVYVAEAWMAVIDKDEVDDDMPAPSEHPDKTEQVLLMVYLKDRTEMVCAEITRKDGPQLGEWKKYGTPAGGRLSGADPNMN